MFATHLFWFMRVGSEFICVSAGFPEYCMCLSISKASLNIYLPPPASTGKQLFYLHWSFPVTNVNKQPIKETRGMGVNEA